MTPTNTEALVRELEQRQISNWIHSTGTPPRVNGTKPDPLCQQAAAELRRLAAVEAERDALRVDAERYPTLTREMPAKALGLDLRRLYVNTREKFDAAIDAAMKDHP